MIQSYCIRSIPRWNTCNEDFGFWNFFNWKFLYRLRPSSVETVSGEDDVVEVSLDENSDDKQEEMQKEHIESLEKYNYLHCLGLITKSKCLELQNRRVERKRRSTANPQFVYSMFEQPSVRNMFFACTRSYVKHGFPKQIINSICY